MVYIDNQAISTKDATITKSISGDFILTFTTYDLPDNVAFHNIVEGSVIFANGYAIEIVNIYPEGVIL